MEVEVQCTVDSAVFKWALTKLYMTMNTIIVELGVMQAVFVATVTMWLVADSKPALR